MVKVKASVLNAQGEVSFGGQWWVNPKFVSTVQVLAGKKNIVGMATGLTLLVDNSELQKIIEADTEEIIDPDTEITGDETE